MKESACSSNGLIERDLKSEAEFSYELVNSTGKLGDCGGTVHQTQGCSDDGGI
jgi:hypothetical protein